MSYLTTKTFNDLYNLESVKKLYANFDKINLDFSGDPKKNKQSQKKYLGQLMIPKPTNYHLAQGKKDGRLYGSVLQFLKKELRNAICKEYYTDVDMKNCQVSILLWWCKKNLMNVPTLNEYCINRDKYYHLKQHIIIVMNGGNRCLLNENDDNFLTKIKEEMKVIHKIMMENIKNIKTIYNLKRKNLENIEGRLCHTILENYESEILQSTIKFLEERGVDIINIILMFDGFMLPNELFTNELLVDLNEYIFKQTTIPVEYIKKEMTDAFVIPNNWVYDAKELKGREISEWYNNEKIKFEETIWRIEQPLQYFIQNDDDTFYLLQKNELIERFSEINCQGNYFTKIWMDDINKKKYKKLDFLPPPKVCPDTTYNLWRGFEIENTIDPTDDIGEKTFLNVISIISNNNKDMETYICNIIAHIIQKPAIQIPVSLVLAGVEGTGKNVFGDIFKKLIGHKYSFETADLENEMFCRFKYNIMNRLLLVINEADPSETFKYEQKLKNWIGNGKIQSFEGKGTKPIDQEIFFFILLITNNRISPVNVTSTDRRYVITEPSDEYRCNEVFWGNIVDNIFSKPENIKGIYNYFKKYTITIKNWSNDRPITAIYQSVKSNCFDKIIKGLRRLIIYEWEYSDTKWFSNEELYKLFSITKTDEESFGSRLGQKTIKGIDAKRKTSCRGWDIDRNQTYEWLKEKKYLFADEEKKYLLEIEKEKKCEVKTD